MIWAKFSILSRLIYGARTAILVIAALIPLRAMAAPTIVLASTTSVQDSGLLDRILPGFAQATGIEVRVIAQGTGQALETARRGDADIVLVHDPEAEEKFIGEGFGIDRRQIAWNDFVIVGPRDDPAHVSGGHNADAALSYGHGICDNVAAGRTYAQLMGDVKDDFSTSDEYQASYLTTQAVNELCPAMIWQLRNSAGHYQPPPGG